MTKTTKDLTKVRDGFKISLLQNLPTYYLSNKIILNVLILLIQIMKYGNTFLQVFDLQQTEIS